MNPVYKRLSIEERYKIDKFLDKNYSIRLIAQKLNRSPSTISRELRTMPENSYRSYLANDIAYEKRVDKNFRRSKILSNIELQGFIHNHIKKKWSPWQISVKLKELYPNDKSMNVSHETIYFYIYLHCKKTLKDELIKGLRQQKKLRGENRTSAMREPKIKDRLSIDERPPEVIGREIPGHWEGDLIIGKNQASAIGTLVERSTRTVILVHLKDRSAETVRKAFEKKFKALPDVMKKTLTYDNGTEMAQHKLFTKNTNVKVYFTHPYSPWERPTNENTNGLLRQYFPKGTDLSTISKYRLQKVQDELNERPRHVLDYKSPAEVFDKMIVQKIN